MRGRRLVRLFPKLHRQGQNGPAQRGTGFSPKSGRSRDGGGGGGGVETGEIVPHTPSTAFRHLPPKEGCRKPMLGV